MNRNAHIISSSFWTFFVATVLSSAIGKLNSIASGIIVGQAIGPDAVSAVNLAYPVLNFIKIPPLFVVLGAGLLAAKAVGERKYGEVRRLFTSAILVSATLSLLFALVVFAFSGEIAKLLTKDDRLLPHLASYLGPVVFSCVPGVIYIAFSVFAKSIGKPRLVIRGALAALLVNLAFTVLFVCVLGLGMKGVAYAMFLGGASAAAALTPLFRADSQMIGFVRPARGWFGRMTLESIKLGIPLDIAATILAAVLLVLNLLVQKIGGADAAFILGIGMQMLILDVFVFNGMSGAVLGIGGALWGEKDMVGYRILLKLVFRILGVTQFAFVALVFLFPEALATVFGADAALAAKAAAPLWEFCLMFLPLCVLMVLVGIYTLEGHGLASTVMQCGLIVFILAPASLAAWFLPSGFWLSIPFGLMFLLLLTAGWSFHISRRDRNLHWFTLAPKTDVFPEYAVSLKTGKASVSAVLDEIGRFLSGRSVPSAIVADVCWDAGEILGRLSAEMTEKGGENWCDIRVVDVGEKDGREIRVIVKACGRRRDSIPGACFRAASVKYDYFNGVNCVYCTFLLPSRQRRLPGAEGSVEIEKDIVV